MRIRRFLVARVKKRRLFAVTRSPLVSRLLLLSTLLLLSLACGQESGVRLTFWQFWPSEIINPIIREFEEANPGIKVEMQQLTWQNGFEKIVAAVASGTQPDLCELGSTWVPRFAADGVLSDLTADVQDLTSDHLFWESCTVEESIYGIPWVAGTRVLFYNKELFLKAGLDPENPPETWSELADCAGRIRALGRDVYGFGMNAGERYILYKKFMPFAWGNGGSILNEDLTRSVFFSQENLDALRFYCSLRELSLMERQDVLDMAFKQGKLGLQISGGWNLRTIPADVPDLDFGVALVPRRSLDRGVHASFAGSEVLVTFVKSKHKQEALKLARFLISKENVISLCRKAKSVQPTLKGAENDPYYESHPLERVFVVQLGTAVPPPPHPRWVEIEEVINTAIEEAVYGLKSPEDALKEADRKIDEIVVRSDG